MSKVIPKERLEKYAEQRNLCLALAKAYSTSAYGSAASFHKGYEQLGSKFGLHDLNNSWQEVETNILNQNDSESSLLMLTDYSLKLLTEIKAPEGSTPYDRQVIYRDLCTGLSSLYPEKNENYDDSFGATFQKYGPISSLTRMSDKWNRINALMTGTKDNVGEPVEDTLRDLANYSLMTIVELRRYTS